MLVDLLQYITLPSSQKFIVRRIWANRFKLPERQRVSKFLLLSRSKLKCVKGLTYQVLCMLRVDIEAEAKDHRLVEPLRLVFLFKCFDEKTSNPSCLIEGLHDAFAA